MVAAGSRTRSLTDRVALVAGATRGAGRGIARALGENGATVYCTGRSVRGRPSEMGRPETIEETAELVDHAGDEGIAVQTDHTVESDVRHLVDRIRSAHGRLDVLVNDVWGGDPHTQWDTPFWQLDVDQGWRMLETAVYSHILTARHTVPLMLDAGHGLLVEVTDGDGYWYRGTLFYDLVKTTVIRLAFDFAEELESHGVTSLAVMPGFLRSEAMLDHFGVTKGTWREAIQQDPHFAESETPLFVGRAVAALAADPDVHQRTGRVFASWTLAGEYGFEDEDGRRPDWGAHFEKTFGGVFRPADDRFYNYWKGYRKLRRQSPDA